MPPRGIATTDCASIVELYEMLRERAPSLVVDVNGALAMAMQSGAPRRSRWARRDSRARGPRSVPVRLAAYAELHTSLDNLEEARWYLERALERRHAASVTQTKACGTRTIVSTRARPGSSPQAAALDW